MSVFAGIAKFFSYVLLLVYIVSFIPALIYILPLGLFILEVDNVGTMAAVSCLITTAAIPLSMAASAYLTIKYSSLKKPFKMFLSASLPFGFVILTFLWAHLISWYFGV